MKHLRKYKMPVVKLTKQDKGFVKDFIETGNGTKSVLNNYDTKDPNYAGVKATRLIRKDKIKNALQTFADRIEDDKLFKVLDEGLEAGKHIYKNNNESGEIEDMGVEADYAVRHKYLETGLKVKSYFPKEGNQTNVQVNINRFKEYE